MTTATTRLQENQLRVGQPLPFDTYDDKGKLLLRKGFVIDSADQLARLLVRGLYREGGAEPASEPGARPGPATGLRPQDKGHRVAVFALLSETQGQLEALLASAAPAAEFSARVAALAANLQRAFKLDSDACIASIQVLHEGRHGVRRMIHSAILCELLLEQTGVGDDERRVLVCAAMTMNIAMLDLQDVLYAQPAAPTPDQRAAVRQHPSQGVAMLRALGVADESWLGIVGQHHETIDGQGYPAQLRGAQISRSAQLLSVADRYGAMATGRAYRAAALPNVALKQIFMDKDKAVDASLAGLLVKAVGIYPPGSVVVLANGDFAVVVKRTKNANQPVVRCVKTYRNLILERPRKRLTSDPAYAIARLIPMSELGFAPDPNLLWDEGYELEAP